MSAGNVATPCASVWFVLLPKKQLNGSAAQPIGPSWIRQHGHISEKNLSVAPHTISLCLLSRSSRGCLTLIRTPLCTAQRFNPVPIGTKQLFLYKHCLQREHGIETAHSHEHACMPGESASNGKFSNKAPATTQILRGLMRHWHGQRVW